MRQPAIVEIGAAAPAEIEIDAAADIVIDAPAPAQIEIAPMGARGPQGRPGEMVGDIDLGTFN